MGGMELGKESRIMKKIKFQIDFKTTEEGMVVEKRFTAGLYMYLPGPPGPGGGIS